MKNRSKKLNIIRERDGEDCFFCMKSLGLPLGDLTGVNLGVFKCSIEHILDRQHGGSNELINLALSHATCNSRRNTWPIFQKLKHAKHPRSEFLLKVFLSIENAITEMGFRTYRPETPLPELKDAVINIVHQKILGCNKAYVLAETNFVKTRLSTKIEAFKEIITAIEKAPL